MNDVKIVPFGKYKGQPIEAMQTDIKYCEWLSNQVWFREKYSTTYNLIINNFGEASETPEHNKMQALFIKKAWLYAFLRCWNDLYNNRAPKTYETILTNGIDGVCEEIKSFFEVKGFDLLVRFNCSCDESFCEKHKVSTYFFDKEFAIELKPVMGDDYPAVLRQIKQNRDFLSRSGGFGVQSCLIVDEFCSEAVNFDELKQIFSTSDILVFSVLELERYFVSN